MSKKVLIVEDYADVRRIMNIMVSRRGYEVIEASDGYDAIEKTKKHHPDLILMDLAMPIMDGVMATQIIREEAEFKNTPIIGLTAYGTFNEKALDAGCNEVINKPLEFESIEPLLKLYLPD